MIWSMARMSGATALLILLAAGVLMSQTPAPATTPSQNGYLGSNVCKTCHPDITSAFFRNPHYKSIASGKETPEHTGCEGCHGPGKAHVAAGGGKTTIPHAFSLMAPKEVLEDCL